MKNLLFIFSFLFAISLIAQDSQKLLKQGLKLQENGDHYNAIPFYREVLMYDNLYDAKKGLASCYKEVKDYPRAEYWYRILLNINPAEPEYIFHYAQMLQNNGKCEEAKVWYREYGKTNKKGYEFAKACENNSQFTKNEDDYVLFQLPFNTEKAEFAPIFYKEGIVYTGGGLSNISSGQYTDLYYTKRLPDYSYSNPVKLKGKVNTPYHDGPASFNAVVNEIWVTRTSNQKATDDDTGEAKRNLKIWFSKKNESKWGNFMEFQYNNTNYSVAHPSISDNGQSLFFVSDMPGGYGGTDIYVCYRRDSTWTKPRNLGPQINTIGSEQFPFLHPDGTLYFASNGHPGLGGLDIFYSTYKGNRWEEPINYGSPINSSSDDMTVLLDYDKNSGYFSSNRYGGKGSDDVYYFELKNVQVSSTPPIDPLNSTSKNILPGIPLNDELNLKEISFDHKKSNLTAGAFIELNKIVDFLHTNDFSKLIIESHTDSREPSLVNQTLSEERVNNIKEYLIANNISKKRIEGIGYGETQLFNHCSDGIDCSKAEHDENDRIIFKLNTESAETVKFGDEPDDSEFLDFGLVYKDELEKSEGAAPKKEPKKKKEKPAKEKALKEKPAKKEKEKDNKKERTKPVNGKKIKEETLPKSLEAKQKAKKSKEKKKEGETVIQNPNKPIEVQVKDRPVPIPKYKLTDRTEGITFKIHCGPFTNIDINLQKIIQDLSVNSSIILKGKKEIVALGTFPSIADSESVLAYLDAKEVNKTKIIVYQNGVPTKVSINSLKEKGFK